MTRTARAPAVGYPGSDVTIEAVLAGRLLQPVFQPIVDLSTESVVALEALIRGPAGTTLEFPDRLFAAARDAGRLGELDMLSAERALETIAPARVRPPMLFLNAEPAVADQPTSARLSALIAADLPFRHVLELTERALLAAPGGLLRLAGKVRQRGHQIALDDVGVNPVSLALLPILEPEAIKIDMSLVRNPHTDHARTVATVVRAQARRTGAVVIAEGIETIEHLAAARDLGARWGQGWLFGRPGRVEDAAARFDPQAATALPRHTRLPDTAATPFQAAARHGQPVTCTSDTVGHALAALGRFLASDDTAVVAACDPAPVKPMIDVSLRHLMGRSRSVILPDTPVPGEFAAVVIGAGYGYGFCLKAGPDGVSMITVHDLEAVADVARTLLHLHR